MVHHPKVKWETVKKCLSYNPQTKQCLLCLNEKLEIATCKDHNLLNKRNEIISKRQLVQLSLIDFVGDFLFDGSEMGSLGTSSLSLLIFSTVSAGCGRYSSTISSTDNGLDSLVTTSLSKSTSRSASRLLGDKSWPSFAKLFQVKL